MNGYKDDTNSVLHLLRCINGDKMILIVCLIVLCLVLSVNSDNNKTHHDSYQGSFYEISNRRDN